MRRGSATAAAVLAAALAAGCAGHANGVAAVDPADAVAVDASSLWDPNATQDPIVTYRLRLAVEPDNPALHNNLGNLYVLRNWLHEAVSEYRKALQLDSESPAVWNNLGTAYMKMGRRDQAYRAFRKSIERDERYALAWYNIGVIYDEQGDYDKAIETYLRAASYQPEILEPARNPQVVNNKHLMALRLRRYLEEEGNLALPLAPLPE